MDHNSSERKQGKLKIFFGYAAGVGKTYAMLEAAHQAQQEGVDVVVGYVERHTRPDTLALLKGLEILPAKVIDYHGIQLKEFDLDQALQRNPELIVIDELAHSNAAGCRHTKRYQDVEECLRWGIDVYTSMNVQHLESLNDLVSSITGVIVKERVPDSIFELASQIELIDIEPQDLVKRLKSGKVYSAVKARQALQHFFRNENLAALREIAMRRTADHLNKTAIDSHQGTSARAAEHILICLSSSPSNAKVIRTAARMAEAFHSSFTALFVQLPEIREASQEDIKRLRANHRLAEQLGAQISTVYGIDPAEQIAEYARISGVTKIIIGRTNHRHPWYSRKKSLADRLMELTDLDIYIIPDQQPLYKKPIRKVNWRKPEFSWISAGKTMLLLLGATCICFLFYSLGLSESNIIIVYILAVLITAVWTEGYVYGIFSSLACTALFNFFFTVPRFSFEAYDPHYPVTFLIMLISSVLASSLASRVQTQASLSAEKGFYTELLLESTQKFQQGRTEQECLRLAAEQLNRLFDRPILYALCNGEGLLQFQVEPEKSPELGKVTTADLAVAKWVYRNNKHAGATTNTLPDSRWLFLAVRSSSGQVNGIIGIDMKGYPAPDAFEKNLMVFLLSACGLSLEKLRLQEETKLSALKSQKERLQSTLLRAVSHDLRTPLCSISGSASILKDCGQEMEEDQRETLYDKISEDADWLIHLSENILAATKLENEQDQLPMSKELIEEIFEEVKRQFEGETENHPFEISLEDRDLCAWMNSSLILRVIYNLLRNAVQYTPQGTRILLKAEGSPENVFISVIDEGEGIEQSQREHLFDLFPSLDKKNADCQRGLGFGLHLCQSIIQRHGGKITVSDRLPHGTVFRFSLKRAKL